MKTELLPPAHIRYSSLSHHRRQPLDRPDLQPPPAPLSPRHAHTRRLRAPAHHRGLTPRGYLTRCPLKRVNPRTNHLKSKGSACDGDADTGDGQGNCNAIRAAAATRLAEWLNNDPTGQGSPRTVVIGDLNSYDHEEPIRALTAADFSRAGAPVRRGNSYSYVFDGTADYLDHALANESAAASIVAADAWHINADEADIFDYDMTFKKDTEDTVFAPTPCRFSDHDPVIISLRLGQDPAPEPSPSSNPTPSPKPVPPPLPSR